MRRATGGWACALVVLLSCGCGSAPSPAADAAVPDAGAPEVDPVDPSPPAAPELACAPGWTLVTAGDVDRCAPFGGGSPARCGDFEMQVPSSASCVLVGSPCADVPPAPAAGRAFYVAPGGEGDGSMGAPFGRIADAISASSAGDSVLLLPGTYEESVRVDRAIAIRGACPERTRIAGPGVAVQTEAPGVVLSDLAVAGDGDGVVVLDGDATLERVVLVDLPQRSLLVGARATVRDSLVIVRDGAAAMMSRGVEVTAGGEATVERSVIRGHHDLSASVVGSLEATDSVFWDRSGFNTFLLGPTTLRRCVVAGADPGLVAFTAASVLEVEDSELRGVGLVVNDEARATFVRSSIVAAPNSVEVSAGAVELRDAVIVDSSATGVRLFRGSTATLERVRLARWRRSGVYADASAAVLRDVELIGSGPDFVPPSGTVPVALELREAATANVERLRVRASVVYGVAAAEDSALRGSDLVVEGGLTEPVGGGGAALLCLRCTVELERLSLADNAGLGVVAGLVGASVRLRELEIARTPPGLCLDESCGAFEGGVGLGSYAGASVRVERFRFADNALMGAQVARGAEIFGGTEVGGELDLSDGVIEDNPMGVNVQLADYDFARLTTRVVFRDNGQSILSSTDEPVPSPPPLGPLLGP